MERTFDLEQAREALAEIRDRVDALVEVRADLAERAHAHNVGRSVPIPDIKAAEARMGEILDSFRAAGIQVKGYAPLLLDFPMRVGDRTVLLCWVEGETELGWYHELETGFMGRRPLARLTA